MKLIQKDAGSQVNHQPFVIVDAESDAEAYWRNKGYTPEAKEPVDMELEELRTYYETKAGKAPDGRWSKQRILDELNEEAVVAPAVVAHPSAKPVTSSTPSASTTPTPTAGAGSKTGE